MPTIPNILYSPLRETQRLLAAGQVWAQNRLNADDLLSTEEAAQFAEAEPELLIGDVKNGRLIGIPSDARGMVFPEWQFGPVFRAAIRAVSQKLNSSDGWTLLRFFESPHIALDGLSPKQAIEQGHPLARIVDLARSSEY